MIAAQIRQLRQSKGFTQEQIAQELGIKRSAYKEFEYGREPEISILIKMADYYGVSLDQLVRQEDDAVLVSGNSAAAYNAHVDAQGARVLAITIDQYQKEYIQLVPAKAKAGYALGMSDPLYIQSLPTFYLPNLSTGTYRAFEIDGDSMPPVSDGSIVVGKYVDHWSQIKSLETYIIVTKEAGVVYKRVINKLKEKGKLICLSDNARYLPFQLKGEDILEVWEYHCHISYDGKNPAQKRLMQELLDMGDEVEELQVQLERITTLNAQTDKPKNYFD